MFNRGLTEIASENAEPNRLVIDAAHLKAHPLPASRI